mgnify:CR=1 FL=1
MLVSTLKQMLYNATDLIKVCDLFEEKKQSSKERDLGAVFYNVMLYYTNKNIDNPEKYKYYLDVGEQMEPYAKDTKERVREINRELCKFSGANDIKETPYHLECEDRYGFSKQKL